MATVDSLRDGANRRNRMHVGEMNITCTHKLATFVLGRFWSLVLEVVIVCANESFDDEVLNAIRSAATGAELAEDATIFEIGARFGICIL
jgi:hypothetical protein